MSKFRAGFTLIEVCIAMTIAMLILGVAVLGISGVQEEQKLREAAAMIESTARDSLLKAVAEHRPVQLDIAGGILLAMSRGTGSMRLALSRRSCSLCARSFIVDASRPAALAGTRSRSMLATAHTSEGVPPTSPVRCSGAR